ncbi:hypothetical protein AAEX28_09075 [Lentisphaerota bacterium WC36G]|nr:hypothetical protein LJT99_11925 [Lentisphaerae bacterium WC36]
MINKVTRGILLEKVLGGVLLPGAMTWYGIYLFVYPQITLYGRGNRLILRDTNAVLCGVMILLVGIFMHLHTVWDTEVKLLSYFFNALKLVTILGVFTMMVMLFIRVLFL